MADILLTTINARYLHASMGLRCLLANLGTLASRARIVEFTGEARIEDIVERLLAQSPRIVGIGVYIWNVDACTRLVAQLRLVAPELTIVLGGPEVSHETDTQRICAMADHVVSGAGEIAFAQLCERLLADRAPNPPALGEIRPPKLISGGAPAPALLGMPYAHYTDEDIRHRALYVEASRGCPFKCEFCLSSLDRTAVPFDVDHLLSELAALHARGARRFRFVDRTFNLKVDNSLRILGFFLERLAAHPGDPVFAHFELVPDHLPPRLRDAIRRFPPGSLQFEIGIQTWNPQVQALISRRQDDSAAQDNLAWLLAETHAQLHVDLIAGLPGEDLDSFGAGFDRLVAIGPHEIQVGILKRLRGAPIARHTEAFAMRFNPDPPYNVLATDRLAFADLQRIGRFARYWDLIGNSGRYRRTLALVLGARPFERFLALTDWLHARTDATHRIALERQFELVRDWLLARGDVDPAQAEAALADDYRDSGARGRPGFLARGLRGAGTTPAATATPQRQARHLAS